MHSSTILLDNALKGLPGSTKEYLIAMNIFNSIELIHFTIGQVDKNYIF